MTTESCQIPVNIGLRGVKIATTRISDVNGDEGRLIYRGYLIQDLAAHVCFEEVAYLLLKEKLPDPRELEAFRKDLAAQRAIPVSLVQALASQPPDAKPMDILQASVALLANADPDLRQTGNKDAANRMAVRLVSRVGTVVAAWNRIRNGLPPIEPDPQLSHAANFLYMLNGVRPDEETARFFDTCLVLHAEHSFNASTFAAREVASTRAHMYAAVSAAVGSLSGDLHGGANVRVMEMLQKIGSIDKVESYVKSELDAGNKIMGLGHAVYAVDDPRAKILEPMSRILGEKRGELKWYELSKAVEKASRSEFKQRKGIELPVNVDFYSASVYHAMGIPVDLFSPVFAVSRVAGWTAHVIEEQFGGASAKPVLYRPESEYVGDYCGPEVCTLTPISSR
ncbi:citrate/2-methylcitrate synthase [Desulfatirhabdium butyrativorans]|uniref:citrate/2-methylcitrate synthase n=1 Tax=Desulfatirhabdium butyrativorans TaxID=340467 RepID=UPI00041BF583|nr:citrate/2-methylcitrate synthase [Desulfatirhabdium butyrativorans]